VLLVGTGMVIEVVEVSVVLKVVAAGVSPVSRLTTSCPMLLVHRASAANTVVLKLDKGNDSEFVELPVRPLKVIALRQNA
jgi:hypothetical protein